MTLDKCELLKLNDHKFPLHLALMKKRLENVGVDASADTWMTLSYVFEVLLKTTAICLISGIGKASQDVAYALKHALIHADGLGTWEAIIGDCCSQSKAGYISREVRTLVEWLTRKRRNDQDPWIFDSVSDLEQIFSVMGLGPVSDGRKLTVLKVFTLLVQLRNKTKGHGAMSLEFYEATNFYFWNAVVRIVNECPVSKFKWYYIAKRGHKKENKAQLLEGLQPKFISVDSLRNLPAGKGIYFQTHENGIFFAVEEMLASPHFSATSLCKYDRNLSIKCVF